ncbi:MAG: hypothetical protein IIZ78_05795 [Clostridiales bacterium]|nr:hypothetical protein [Clostridiales bacterium]
MNKGGRPPKVNIEDLINGVDAYLETADPPIVAEYAHMNNITRQYLYEIAKKDERLSDAIKKISEAKEVMLEQKAIKGQYNASMAIFSLKQLGWKDKQEEKSDDDDMVKQFLEKIIERG